MVSRTLLLLYIASVSSKRKRKRDVPNSKFDVVIFRGRTMRWLFLRMLDLFRCPDERQGNRFWYLFKSDMEKPKTLEDVNVLPVLAIRRGGRMTAPTGVPCGAAFYTDAHCEAGTPYGHASYTDVQPDTFVLEYLIRDASEHCRGAGAAILCYLIRHSKDKEGKFSPLKLTPPPEEDRHLALFYKSFGCIGNYFAEPFYEAVHCDDPNPPKCEDHVDNFFDADAYYGSFVGSAPGSLVQSYQIPTQALFGSIATFGILLGLLRSLRGISIANQGRQGG
eukprot:gnl/TRDRNA2_/TRDRNA2_64122_c0_seq1.p1 gnl/TRDRNA2_/TRDRNA2_64122_c0~~gnl/TRDRNA2_/TRDRNA2_64122_c0_seq1.p1  ORF type:complete len:278 (-),score=18.52 gnl/TRDRNA2_/TRDRNA2_64122_c0_seq1:36-869(-)